MAEIEDVIDEAKKEAAVLKQNGAAVSVERFLTILDSVAEAVEPLAKWLSESDALLRSGRSKGWLRARYATLQADGYARMVGGHRQYRACALPRRTDVETAAAQGRAAARAAKKKAAL